MRLIIAAAALVTSIAHSDPKTCAKCSEMKALETELNALNYFSPKDSESGSDKAVKSLALINAVTKLGKYSPEEFAAVVTLAAAADPYDVETQNASAVAAFIDKNTARHEAFKQALNQVEEICRRKDLEYQVENYLCQFGQDRKLKARGKVKIQDTSPGACVKEPVFNIETCLNGQGAHGAAKPPVALEKKSTPNPRNPSSNSEE